MKAINFVCPKCQGLADVILRRENYSFRLVCMSDRVCKYEGPEIKAPPTGKLEDARKAAYKAARATAGAPNPPKYKKPVYIGL